METEPKAPTEWRGPGRPALDREQEGASPRVTLRVPQKLLDEVKLEAERRGVSISKVFLERLRQIS